MEPTLLAVSNLMEICPSRLNPTSMEIKVKHIQEGLEHSLHTDICMLDRGGPDFRGKYLGRLHLSGCSIEFSCSVIDRIFIDDNSISLNKTYKLQFILNRVSKNIVYIL
jgi:5'-nucleotidase